MPAKPSPRRPLPTPRIPEKLKLARVVVINDANGQQRNVLYPLQVGFKKRGQSGIEVSDWLPHLGDCVDDLAIVRSMYTTDDNHGAQTQFHSGRHMLDGEFPTLGAWVHYGLGTLNDNLPQFISLGNREYWNNKDGHYLGPAHDAVPLRIDRAIRWTTASPKATCGTGNSRLRFDLVGKLNQLRKADYPDDAALDARIKSYELAFRMQKSLPDVLDFGKETEETKKLYGLDEAGDAQFRHADAGGAAVGGTRRALHPGAARRRRRRRLGRPRRPEDNHARNCIAVDKPIARVAQGPETRAGSAEGDAGGLRHASLAGRPARRAPMAGITTSTASPCGWPAAASRAASSMAPPTTSASTPSSTAIT